MSKRLSDLPVILSAEAQGELMSAILDIIEHYQGNGVVVIELRHAQVYRVRREVGRTFTLMSISSDFNNKQ